MTINGTQGQEDLINRFEEMGALVNGHFVYRAKSEGSSYRRHGGIYVNKDLVSSYPSELSSIVSDSVGGSQPFGRVDVVASPAIGAIVFGSCLADVTESRFVYAEQEGEDLNFKRGFASAIPGKRVVVAEDIVTSGSTLRRMISAVTKLGGEVIGVFILWQRGDLDLADIKVAALVDKRYPTYEAEKCPLCIQKLEIDTEVGHGDEFLQEFGDDPENWPANRNK